MKNIAILLAAFVALFAVASFNNEHFTRFVGAVTSIAFPLATRYTTDANAHITLASKRELSRRTKYLAVVLVGTMAILELLFKRDQHFKHILELFACILVSNATLLIIPSPLASKTPSANQSTVSNNPNVAPPHHEASSTLKPTAPSPSLTEMVHTILDAGEEIIVANQPNTTESSMMSGTNVKVAINGNGQNKPLSDAQLQMCVKLQKMIIDDFIVLFRAQNCEGALLDYCDVEACRRFLVARSWSLSKARAQLSTTLAWRLKGKMHQARFVNSSLASNPYAFNMRVVGLDTARRPIIFTCFQHALDRFSLDTAVECFQLILEETSQLITSMFRSGETESANQLQWVFVVDFTGFSVRDANPVITYHCGKLMTYFPEMLNQAVLIDAPLLFSSAWNMLLPVLDERVREKIVFSSLKNMRGKLEIKLGTEAVDWLEQECQSSRSHKSAQGKRKYWTVQQNGHDARGCASYVGSKYYIDTAGDAWEKKQQESR